MRTLRRNIAFALVGMADCVWPSPSLGVLSNAELDAHLARRRRRRKAGRAIHPAP
ncbi:MAG: hypothetical protein M3340_02150 [Actinomycetota bacterium]|nr:hypothetical protein [Actinomycetota bacterium]